MPPNTFSLEGALRTTSELPMISAIVNLKIKDYSFSGNNVEKISVSGTKDESVYKGVKHVSYAKNIEFRL